MQNVTINSKKFGVVGDTPVKLNNGSLVLHYNKLGDVMGAYIVTSFRDSKGKYHGDQTSPYCSLVNLDNGYIKFEERCSRTTTQSREFFLTLIRAIMQETKLLKMVSTLKCMPWATLRLTCSLRENAKKED